MGDNPALTKLVQSLQGRLDAHGVMFNKSYRREKDLKRENKELKEELRRVREKEIVDEDTRHSRRQRQRTLDRQRHRTDEDSPKARY